MQYNDFLDFRKKGIGGSDVAAILKHSPFMTPLMVYNSKVGIPYHKENSAIKFGKLEEPIIGAWYEQETGEKISCVNHQIIDKDNSIIRGNIDAMTNTGTILEFKAVFNCSHWGTTSIANESVPSYYLTQIAYYASILDADVKLIAKFSLTDYRIYHYERDTKIENFLRKAAVDFWKNHVLSNSPPPPTKLTDISNFSIPSSEFLPPKVATQEFIDNLIAYKHLKKKLLDIKKEKEEYECKVRVFFEDTTKVINEKGEIICKYPSITRKQVDSKLLKKEYPEVYEKVLYPVSYRRLY